MSVCAVSCCARSESESPNGHFLQMLPTITRIARRAFRTRNTSDREELVSEAIASSFVQFRRLQARGAADRAYATPLGHYGVRHAHVGRRVGGHLNSHDVSSAYCRRRRKVNLVRLTRPASGDGSTWQEILTEDRRATPADVAAIRLDFTDWLSRLSSRQRRIALYLASGEPTCSAAARFGVTAGRIAQMRSELRQAWEAFQGEDGTRSPARPVRQRQHSGRC